MLQKELFGKAALQVPPGTTQSKVILDAKDYG